MLFSLKQEAPASIGRGTFTDTILSELVAEFEDLALAKDFVEYQATMGESYAILKDGVRIDEW